MRNPHPPQPSQGPLAHYWSRTVQELVEVSTSPLRAELQDRHQIFCWLVMALVTHYWNGDIHGREGQYNYRKAQLAQTRHETYLRHNIACVAVDGFGHVIDFDFNHNELFNSSLEHAEARLVRRLFSLAQINDPDMLQLPRANASKATSLPGKAIGHFYNWVAAFVESTNDERRLVDSHYSKALKNVTLYTSLESCAQCSGIMALGYVKGVIFLQRDPLQNSIGNILFNLTAQQSRLRAPLPIPADTVGVTAFDDLNKAFQNYCGAVKTKPFYVNPARNKRDDRDSIVSFLCTDVARDIFESGADRLKKPSAHPKYRPPIDPRVLTNGEALSHARNFFRYATTLGRRGSPHTL